jgi:hypothetical protein
MTPELHLQIILGQLEEKLSKKYMRGQAEHGGYLWEKPGMLMMNEQEILDQITYHFTLRDQITSALEYLKSGDAKSCELVLEKILGEPVDK